MTDQQDAGCADGTVVGCREVIGHASEIIDGDCPKTLLVRLKTHLGFCPPCQSLVTSLQKTVNLVKKMPKEKCPDSVKASILAKTKAAK